jgi:hypothetical protein
VGLANSNFRFDNNKVNVNGGVVVIRSHQDVQARIIVTFNVLEQNNANWSCSNAVNVVVVHQL